MTITQRAFGRTGEGEIVTLFRLENEAGSWAEILDYGCTIRALSVPDRDGRLTDVCLGYDTLAEYENSDGYLGAAVGRVANRIGGGRFTLGGVSYSLAVNNGPNHLHGGLRGFDKFIWDAAEYEGKLVFSRLSPDGEEGYPGDLDVRISYLLTEDHALEIAYEACSDKDTVVNLTNHAYFNLSGQGSVLDHALQVFASHITENDENCLPTGKILPVEGTPFDFLCPKPLGRDIGVQDGQLRNGGGYDHNFVLDDPAELKKAAILTSVQTGIVMAVWTTLPGVQVYSANGLTARTGKNGVPIGVRDALCLETQFFPNAMAFPQFPSCVLPAGECFSHRTEYRFSLTKK